MGRSVFKHNKATQITLELPSIAASLNSVRVPQPQAVEREPDEKP